MNKDCKIIIHCPYCGKEIELSTDIENEILEQEINCKCKNSFKIEYDKVMGRMEIIASMDMKEGK